MAVVVRAKVWGGALALRSAYLLGRTARFPNVCVRRRPTASSPNDPKSISQCAPWTYHERVLKEVLTNELLEEMLALVKKTVFKTLLGMQSVHPKKRVMQFLVECFDEDRRRFIINGQPINVKKLVEKIIGLPNGGKHICIEKAFKELHELRKLLSKGGKSMSVNDGFDYMKNGSGLTDINRLIVFILQSCAYFLAPKTNRNLERSFLSIFKDVKNPEDIDLLNWADFIPDFLVDGIVEYKRTNGSKCSGCLYILAVIFYDLVIPDKNKPDKGFPRINHITKREMDKLDVADLLTLSKSAMPLKDSLYNVEADAVTPDASMATPDASMASVLLQDLQASTTALLLEVSDVPEEEATIMRSLMYATTTKGIRGKAGRLEEQLQKRMASCKEKIKEQQKIIAGLVDLVGNARHA